MLGRIKKQLKHSHKNKKGVCHVIAVDMGYGHERPANALKDISHKGEIWVANNYKGIPKKDKEMWTQGREIYEAISRLKPIPILGHYIFEAMDRMQQIPPFYPHRDLSKPTLQLKQQHAFIKKGLGKHLVEKLAENPLPLVSTFPLPAFAAETYDYPNDIYLVCTDSDVSRAWVQVDSHRSRIKYFAPTGRVVERLQMYGVKRENIIHTGFPMAKSLIGGSESTIIKKDLKRRLNTLDPHRRFFDRYYSTLERQFGKAFCKRQKLKPPTIAFAVGGAGAQKTLGINIAKSLKALLVKKRMKLILVAGARKEVASYFHKELKKLKLDKVVEVLYKKERRAYFTKFDERLRDVDILWTKPSELSFYTGLGIPIIMSPSVGSQEEYNRLWLGQVGGGIAQHDEQYTHEWLLDWIESGALARMAFNGFIEAPTHGIYRIEDAMLGRHSELPPHPMIV